MLEYGRIEKYINNRGFGFIKSINPQSKLYNVEVFFHIKNVKKFEKYLIKFSGQNFKNMYLWFTWKEGLKGKKVINFYLSARNIPNDCQSTIMKEYSNILKELNTKLINEKLINQKQKRSNTLLSQNNKIITKSSNPPIHLNQTQLNELNSLISNMKKQNFQFSSQLTIHLKNNNLQHLYPNIVGQVTMNNIKGDFIFEGGLEPDIYYHVCDKLKLKNNNSGSTVKGFSSYNYLQTK
jgi:cold shock CspA family protein